MRNYVVYNAFNQATIILTRLAFAECLKVKEMKAKLFSASIVGAEDVLREIVDFN